MRDRRMLSSLALLVVCALAGCGISETGPEKRDGGAAIAQSVVAAGEEQLPPPVAESRNANSVVTNFLQAAVGGDQEAIQRAATFLTTGAAEAWQRRWGQQPPDARQELTVIRASDPYSVQDGVRYKVSVTYRATGTISSDGSFTPFPQPARTIAFNVEEREPESGQWRISNPPDTLMISEQALDKYYSLSPVYYWDRSNTRLVPDLRYLPLTMPAKQRANQVVEWLLGGPSPMLRPAVNPLRSGTVLESQVVPDANVTVVNLSRSATSDNRVDQIRLLHQLQWTLLDYTNGNPVELQIEGQRTNLDGSTDAFRHIAAAAADRKAELFSISNEDGKVAPVAEGQQLAVLAAKSNANVEYAAITADHSLAAFVPKNGNRLTVASADSEGKLTERKVALPGPPGRPAWIPGLRRLLVPVNGRLYSVSAPGKSDEVVEEEVVLNGIRGVRSVSVAPEGRRVAVATEEGHAYVFVLAVGEGTLSAGSEPRRVAAGLLTAAAVAWGSTDRPSHAGWAETVFVAGDKGGKAALWRVTADGAIVRDESPNEQALTDVLAFPAALASQQADTVARTKSAVFYAFPNKETTKSKLDGYGLPFYAAG